MTRITVMGALVYDIVFDVPDWVEPNHAVHATEVTVSPGGKALNQAVAACLLGADDVRLIGCVGDDAFGADMLQAAARFGVNTDCVRRHPTARTSLAGIVVKDNLPGFIGAPDASRRVDRRQPPFLKVETQHNLEGKIFCPQALASSGPLSSPSCPDMTPARPG